MNASLALVPGTEDGKAILRRSSDNVLMPPPPKRIKRPKNIINEEAYTDALSEIIARDFFPGLLESETQHEYLDALDSKNEAWISSASRRLDHLTMPGRHPGRRGTSMKSSHRHNGTPIKYTGDTPASTASGATASGQDCDTPHVNTNLSLTEFQRMYTSEDNESFYRLLDVQNQKRADKYAWMWSDNCTRPSGTILKHRRIKADSLHPESSLLIQEGRDSSLASYDVSRKPARPDSWKSKPNNQLFFSPEGVEVNTIAQQNQAHSRAGPVSISYTNTRLPAVSEDGLHCVIPPSPTFSAVRDAIAGDLRKLESEAGIDGTQTPRVNGYAFVDDEEPRLEPRTKSVRQASNLSADGIVGSPFVLKPQSRREDLHHRLVDMQARSKRESLRNGMIGKTASTPIPNFASSPRIGCGQLSPAGQRLWSCVGSKASLGSSFTSTSCYTKSRLGTQYSKDCK